MAESDDVQAKRQLCWNNALAAHGTGYIFERRASRLRLFTRALTFSGIIVPALIGVMATSFYQGKSVPDWCIHSATVVGAVQLILSIWALVAKWDDSLAHALQSMQNNYDLQSRWETLAGGSPNILEAQFDQLSREDAKQRANDTKELVTDKERRQCMRAGFFKYLRECAGCDQVPKSRRLPLALWKRKCDVGGSPQQGAVR